MQDRAPATSPTTCRGSSYRPKFSLDPEYRVNIWAHLEASLSFISCGSASRPSRNFNVYIAARLHSYSRFDLNHTQAGTMYHNYSKSMMIGLAIAFMILPFVFVCLRLWAKRISKRIGWDDFLTIAALAVSLTCSILQLASKLCSTRSDICC